MVPVDPAPASYPEPRESAGTFDVLLSLAASDLRARYGQGSSRLLKWLLDAYATLGVYLLLVAVFWYLVLITLLYGLQSRLERHYSRGHRRAVANGSTAVATKAADTK